MGLLGNAYYFDDVHGYQRCIRGLPLARRTRGVQLFAEFRVLALAGKSLQFWELYDRTKADGSINKLHSPRFAELVNQLLRLHDIEPEWVSADMAASLLISDGDDVGILEQIEFPKRQTDDESGEAPDPDIDPDAQFLAALATHVGGLQDAIALAATEPQVELAEVMRANAATQRRMQAEHDRKHKSKPPSKGKKSKPQPEKVAPSEVSAAKIQRLRESYEKERLNIMGHAAKHQRMGGQQDG